MSNEINAFEPVPPTLRRHSNWLLGLGVLFVFLGTIGLVMTVALTLVSVLFLGVLIIIGGFGQFIDAFKSRGWSSVLWHTLIAILYVLGGLIIIYDPFLASFVITAMLAGVLIVIGIARIFMAFSLRHSPGWFWMLFAGILAVILGILILAQWPWSGLWFIGLLIAIDLIITGWTYVVLALAMKQK